MRGEIVHDHADDRGIGKVDINQFTHAVGEVLVGTSICDLDPAPGT
jgi:hypothetical protein